MGKGWKREGWAYADDGYVFKWSRHGWLFGRGRLRREDAFEFLDHRKL